MAEESAADQAQEAEAAAPDAGAETHEHTYEELHAMTVAQLRDLASGIEHEAVQGYSQLNKEHLLPKICEALGIVPHEHHAVAAGIDKASIKSKIRDLKADRQAALDARDKVRLKPILREIKHLKRELRQAMV